MTIRRFPLAAIMASAPLLAAAVVGAHIFSAWLPLEPVGYLDPFGHERLDRYTGVTSDGRRAWLATRDRGVATLEVSEAGAPRSAGRYAPSPLPEFRAVVHEGNTGFFATEASGIHVVDLHGDEPRLLSRIDSTNAGFDHVHDLAVQDGRLFVTGGGSSQLRVFDVRSPAAPRLVRRIETGERGELRDIALAGKHGYVAGTRGRSGGGAVYLVSLADPKGVEKVIETGAVSAHLGVTPDERFLVVGHARRGGAVSVHDLASEDPSRALARVGASDYELNAYSPSRIRVRDQVAYVAWHQAGVQVIDLDTLDTSGKLQRLGMFGTARGMSPLAGAVGNVEADPSVAPDRILLVDTRWGLFVVDARHVLPDPKAAPTPPSAEAGAFQRGTAPPAVTPR
ncbi:MAG: hypothetical protein VCB78_06445 [Myxococcota bacterium]